MFKQKMLGLLATGFVYTTFGAEQMQSDQERIAALEKQVAILSAELKTEASDFKPLGKLHLGGYGEIHGNFEENGKSQFDIHRLVMYVGYDFADWIKLNSEIEIEHAYVSDGTGGELSVEQLYVDFLFADGINARAGRMLAPMGIVNENHEPTLFFGVERPNVDKYIIPSTWSVDGIGIFGSPQGWLSYQAYVVGDTAESFAAQKNHTAVIKILQEAAKKKTETPSACITCSVTNKTKCVTTKPESACSKCK